jgi:uncharacterized membrane protein
LEETAKKYGVTVYLAIHPGKLAYPASVAASISHDGAQEDDSPPFLRCHIDEQQLDQDPRFGW